MNILIIGAAGMIGDRLLQHLLDQGQLGRQPVAAITAFDVAAARADPVDGVSLDIVTGDLADEGMAETLLRDQPDVIFHLAAVVSGEAETDFDKGYRVNLDGTRQLFDAIRHMPDYCPRVVYGSSISVFGAPFDGPIGDDFLLAPMTSYGTQKAICELLLNDYSRRGFMDGIGLRLPAIVVRPGRPNKAASGFFSGIIREPLAGVEAILPVEDGLRHWLASPDAAVGFLLHAAVMDLTQLGARRCLTMPGLSITVGQMIDALRDVAGAGVAGLIRRQPDAAIRKIAAGWPQDFTADRALAAGFKADPDFQAIIRAHLRDKAEGRA